MSKWASPLKRSSHSTKEYTLDNCSIVFFYLDEILCWCNIHNKQLAFKENLVEQLYIKRKTVILQSHFSMTEDITLDKTFWRRRYFASSIFDLSFVIFHLLWVIRLRLPIARLCYTDFSKLSNCIRDMISQLRSCHLKNLRSLPPACWSITYLYLQKWKS